jgi:hypothetical protein
MFDTDIKRRAMDIRELGIIARVVEREFVLTFGERVTIIGYKTRATT